MPTLFIRKTQIKPQWDNTAHVLYIIQCLKQKWQHAKR